MTDTDHREITEFRNWVFDALQTVNDGNCNMGPLADEIAKVAAAMARVEPDHDPAQQRKLSDSDVAELDAALVKSTEHQYDIDRPDHAQGLYDALKPFVDLAEEDCGEPDCPDCGPYRKARAALAEFEDAGLHEGMD